MSNSLPKVKDSLTLDLNKTDELTEMGRRLELNVAYLKEKIAQARDEANRVRICFSLEILIQEQTKIIGICVYAFVSLCVKCLLSVCECW